MNIEKEIIETNRILGMGFRIGVMGRVKAVAFGLKVVILAIFDPTLVLCMRHNTRAIDTFNEARELNEKINELTADRT